MTLGPQEIVRSEVEGGLSGPANSLTAKSIDCGCGLYQLPRLAKFATRRIFLALLCGIGVLQATAQAYLYVTSSAVARRFQIDPYLMEWILCVSEIAPIFLALAVAYWGDRIHRASWLGGLTLLQCFAFLALIIPHVSHNTKIIEETENITHMSIHAEESPDLCMRMSSSLTIAENPPRYTTAFILIATQIVNGIANIAFYALGISYLDDNTKRLHVPVYISLILATKILGTVLGYMIGWAFLRIDADNLSSIESYRNQTGAWWLGWPIFAFFLIIPSIPMAIFPRKLPSEMVEETAATILDQSGTLRGSQRLAVKKVGSPDFFPSMLRLLTNKILIFNLLAAAFLMTALINFISNENIFLESRFYAPRPTGMLSGFGDPLVSRIITTIMKPLLIGLTVIITGLVIARAKPTARTLVYYSFGVLGVSALIIFCLAFNNCKKPRIHGAQKHSITLLHYCNMDCRCSRDADFRPIYDSKGTFVFYSPCHAGCTSVESVNNNKIYSNCSCVEDQTGLGNHVARFGSFESDTCQVGWIIYEILTLIVYTAAASTMVGDLLISLRSVNTQDKALTIGYSMMILGFLVYIPGKISYDELAKSTCLYWKANDQTCRLHDSNNLGNYLCFLTGSLIIVSALFKIGVWFSGENLEMYDPSETEEPEPREMKDISQTQAEPLLQPKFTSDTAETEVQRIETVDVSPEPVVIAEIKKLGRENGPVADVVEGDTSGSRLKYGPLGPGDQRNQRFNRASSITNTDNELDDSDDSQVPRKGSVSQVSYKPLELDSDVESDLSGAVARSRKRISSSESAEPSKPPIDLRPPFTNIRFPNPDNYEDPRVARTSRTNSLNDGSSKTNSFEFKKKPTEEKPLSVSRGDFNEVGIPVVETYEAVIKGSTSSLRSPTIMMAIQQLDRNPSRELLEQTRFTYRSTSMLDTEEKEENRKFRLEKLMQPLNYSSANARPPSRDQTSSGFGSLQDMGERLLSQGEISDSRESFSSKSSTSGPQKKGGPLCTDL